jgi:hypothetical protein
MIAGLAGFQGSHRPTGRLGRLAIPAAFEVPPLMVGRFSVTQPVFPGFERITRKLDLGFANDELWPEVGDGLTR